jgi:hypothetical protein
LLGWPDGAAHQFDGHVKYQGYPHQQ